MISEWYGHCRWTRKTKRIEGVFERSGGVMRLRKFVLYDLVFDAAVVNPPGVVYGVPAETKVRKLKAKR